MLELHPLTLLEPAVDDILLQIGYSIPEVAVAVASFPPPAKDQSSRWGLAIEPAHLLLSLLISTYS